MNKPITLGMMLIAVAAMGLTGVLTASVNADKTLTCDTSKDCNVIIRKLKVGDDLIIQFKAAPPSTGGSTGGGGTTSTIDQQARDDISGLKSADVTQDNELNRLNTEHTGITGNLSALSDKVTAQANEIEMLKAVIANISTVNPIVDINVTHPGQNVTQPEPTPTPIPEPEPVPVPPVENNTGGGGNVTEPTPPVSNETGGSEGNVTQPTPEPEPVPPVENNTGTVTPPADNVTNVDNGTGTFPVENTTTTSNTTTTENTTSTETNTTTTGNETFPTQLPASFDMGNIAKQLGF